MRTWTKVAQLALAAGFCLAMGQAATAADDDATPRPTFYKDVLPILQTNCQDCHRAAGKNFSGMIAPMSLVSYAEVRPWAKSIARKVQSREMPPWDASPEYHGVFVNERTLTDKEIAAITRWSAMGAPRGRPEDAPEPIVFADNEGGWALGRPDLIVSLPEPFFVKDEVNDLYVTLYTEISEQDLPEDRYVKSVEFKPGPAVHHIISSVGGLAPGTDPTYYPYGFERVLKKGTKVRWQMHYHKESGPGTGVMDETKVGMRFHPKDMKIRYRMGGGNVGNMGFEIPPGAENWQVGAAKVFENDTFMYAFMPHMHLRGKAAEYIAFYPDGTSETLLSVPKYDFNWQTRYKYAEPKFIPGGTRIEVKMWFDNSSERRALVPEINTDRPVRFGGPTTDEMALGWYTTITPVDENDWEQPRIGPDFVDATQ